VGKIVRYLYGFLAMTTKSVPNAEKP